MTSYDKFVNSREVQQKFLITNVDMAVDRVCAFLRGRGYRIEGKKNNWGLGSHRVIFASKGGQTYPYYIVFKRRPFEKFLTFFPQFRKGPNEEVFGDSLNVEKLRLACYTKLNSDLVDSTLCLVYESGRMYFQSARFVMDKCVGAGTGREQFKENQVRLSDYSGNCAPIREVTYSFPLSWFEMEVL